MGGWWEIRWQWTGGVPWLPRMRYWLFKSEPDVFSFQDLKSRPGQREPWNGVRNYQARNYMRDDMAPGDLGLFYHSSCAEPGVAGILRVVSEAVPDPTQFDPKGEYHDPASTVENPRWCLVEVAWAADLKFPVTLPALRAEPALADMLILRKGNRLSITPVEATHFMAICQLGGLNGKIIRSLTGGKA